MVKDFIKDGEVLCDMFCGVGPLAVRVAAKQPKTRVLANDLNPVGVEYLKKNIKLNKCGDRVIPFNMDAKKFLRMLVDVTDESEEKKRVPKEYLKFQHCYMNLPMLAVEFLDCFIGSFNNADKTIWQNAEGKYELPLIHVYGFTQVKEEKGAKKYFTERIQKAMRYADFKEEDIINFHNIRDVSSSSHMYSTTFRLPEAVAFSKEPYEL